MDDNVMVSTLFMAIPKKYDYPEDLEMGIYFTNQAFMLSFHPEENCYIVIERTEKKEDLGCSRKRLIIDQIENTYNLDDYWIFIDGKLVNKEDQEID